MSDMTAPAHYPKSYSYKPMLDALHKQEKSDRAAKKTKEKTPPVAVTPLPTELPTLASPLQPIAGDVLIRHLLSDGGRLTKLKRGDDTYYHLKSPDGRQIFLEKKPGESLLLLIADKRGRPLHSMACEL